MSEKTQAPQQVKSTENKPTHPSYIEMLTSAVLELKNRNRKGVTLPSIRNYVSSTYDISADKGFNTQIKKAMTKLIEKGHMSQNSGTGFSSESRFKLVEAAKKNLSKPVAAKKKTPVKKPAAAKTSSDKKTTPKKVTPAKKTTPAKKPAANSKKSVDDKPKKKTPSKSAKENSAKVSNKDSAVAKSPVKSKRLPRA